MDLIDLDRPSHFNLWLRGWVMDWQQIPGQLKLFEMVPEPEFPCKVYVDPGLPPGTWYLVADEPEAPLQRVR